MQTPERFRSLASTLLAPRAPELEEVPETSEPMPPDEQAVSNDERLAALREVRLFRAGVIEAVEAAVETITADIAADVLGRELLLAPADIESIVDRALQRFAGEEPMRVRLHDDDAAQAKCALPVVRDPALRRGDAIIELRSGSIDVSLGIRLETLLAASARSC